ncbi:similar to 6430573F11Rik protein (predicted), isoform CRA_d [Rattus norvegicus]|uniref:Probable tRNA methyltransferase 9B n=4 Tax=Rattus norvegicus TaxID=10116 RepID=A6IVK2_RAT|nr:probable tRNA methyltransferase 9B [Rattus norvegicus]XP_006253284.1 probable tRNA methyltransferase 9B isoform X1 [Rattus norvegicus]XP_006253285.1 probable tRNA methyltransferase 9B isoform X1 [Rattus norvegicus]EDM09213.1 similar to 6430573F11Rik protein (predicted), isoform CRA_d [Rattus norvegicus]EDM09218.1 similar to 6430573F11Rik protein (predicted), isoform CRA_d [Rattus norvegicus]|eukprot:NP_001100784.1 probable tRNA methyltransferase 9-like protein [Rattus norvegicus]
MDPEAVQLEKQHVHKVYESTAPYFSDLQNKAWPRVRQFLQDQKPGSLIADIGCGTGKYLKVNSQVHTLGCDYCGPLVEIARNRGCEVMVCDNLNLPFRDQGFDAIISIGVIHHFSTKQRRIRAIKEMARVLAPGGQLMIYVWAMEQKNRHFEKQDVLVPWNRALCSRLLSESHQSWGHSCEHPTSQGYQGPGSACSCAVCFKGRCDSKRSHSMDYGPAVARTCCEAISKEGQQENGLYSNFGKSFRSWFFSRSLDESTLRKQIERVRPMKIEGWANSTVSHQPSRYPSVDLHAQEPFSTKRPNLDEVFVDASSQRHVGCLGVPSTSDNFIGHKGGESRRKEGGNFLDTTDTGNSVAARNGGDRSARKILRRVSAFDSTDSTSEDPSFVEGQQDGPDSKAFMRYYHVFREGELSSLLQECVSELQVLSSGNDHGNWCIIAEKKRSWD